MFQPEFYHSVKRWLLDFALNGDVQTLCQDPVMREFPVCSERNFATGSDYFSSREGNPAQPFIICDLCFGLFVGIHLCSYHL